MLNINTHGFHFTVGVPTGVPLQMLAVQKRMENMLLFIRTTTTMNFFSELGMNKI